MSELSIPVVSASRLLTAARFEGLADDPPELEWFANIDSKTPALGDHQARALLEAPDGVSLEGKRDRAILATLLYHALRREELCKLTVKDFKHQRRGVAHLKVSGKGSRTRYVPLHPAASRLIVDYLEADGRGLETTGALFRSIRSRAREVPAALRRDGVRRIRAGERAVQSMLREGAGRSDPAKCLPVTRETIQPRTSECTVR